MFATSSDAIAGRLVVAIWFVAFSIGLLALGEYSAAPESRLVKRCAVGSLIIGLVFSFLLPPAVYVPKFVVMLVVSLGIVGLGVLNGKHRYTVFGLLAAALAYVAVGLQYTFMKMAR
ncbi:hypothetical protein ACDH70_18075 [Xanthomonas axonopodis pv. poinsettiicola]|uniref:hypothetical protein n=1 Tax=Xanthomonas TaxID=338 RepID=UPI001E29EBEB|nr:hypothetical protein [Xanthomonas codiaei]MCC8539335.1 hypothetical protein [Xanthomonas codiaei]